MRAGPIDGGLEAYAWAGVLAFAVVFAALDQLLCEMRVWARWRFVERTAGMSTRTFAAVAGDSARRVMLNATLAVPACLWVLWPFAVAPFGWAWPASGVLMIVGTAFLFWARPNLIAPLFERFEPLAPGELRQRLEAMMQRCGTRLEQVLVVDTSRRSRGPTPISPAWADPSGWCFRIR